jgi:2'-5' RNA ligase
MPTLQDTILLAKNAHSLTNATDKGGKTPYYWHLVRVMLRLQTTDLELLQIAILHDIVEDTDITLDKLRELGYSERVIEGVKWSSKNLFDLTFSEWMRKIGTDAPIDTVLLKIADISDNLGFERMTGLMKKNFYHTNKISQELDLRQRVDKFLDKKMKLFGEMGVYERYYKGWNFMFENKDRLHLIEQVFLGDFCHLSQLLNLTNYIPHIEMESYLHLNKIHTLKMSAKLEIIKSKIGQDYLALVIDNNDIAPYINFLNAKIDNTFIQNQQNRDKQSYHITIINVSQFSALQKNNNVLLDLFLKNNISKTFEFYTYGIGAATNETKQSQAWFVVCQNPELKQLRENLSLSNHDFHITLAFDKSDVFEEPKDKSSIIYKNDELWKNFLIPHYTPQKKNKP